MSGPSNIWYLATMHYRVLPGMRFLVVGRDDTVGYQYSNSRVFHLALGVLVPSPARLQTRVNDHGFCHFVNGYAFDHASAYVAVQRSIHVN